MQGKPRTIIIILSVCIILLIEAGWVYRYFAGSTGSPVLSLFQKALQASHQLIKAGPQEALPASHKPIPAGPKAFTEKDFQKVRVNYYRKLIPEAYKKIGVKDPAWDKAALDLLGKYADCMAGNIEVSQLLAPAHELMGKNCKDPYVSYVIGVVLMYEKRMKEAEPYVQQAVEGFEQVPYSKAVVWSAPIRLVDLYRQLGGRKAREIQKLSTLGIKWLGKGAAEKVFAKRERRVFWGMLAQHQSNILENRGRTIYQAVSQEPKADPWLLHMIGGVNGIYSAWKARGGGWASEVKPGGWQKFSAELDTAREHLTKAWQLQPDYPEAPAEMIAVVKGGSAEEFGETERLWFDRAVAAQMDYGPAYSQLREALLPRWGGSHEEMYQFGLECLATKRFDTDTPMWFYRFVWEIDNRDGNVSFWQKPGVYSNLLTLFKGFIAEPSQAKEINMFKSLWAVVAWRSGKYKEARKLLEELAGKFNTGYFGTEFNEDADLAISEIYAVTGPAKTQVQQAEAFCRSNKPDSALAVFEKVLDSKADPKAEKYLRERMAAVQVEAALLKDQWVSLPVKKGLPGWHQYYGGWSATDDGAIAFETDADEPALLLNSRVGQHFELAGEIEFLGDKQEMAAGFLISYGKNNGGGSNIILIYREGYLTIEPSEGEVLNQQIPSGKDRYNFVVRVKGDKAMLLLDGKEVAAGPIVAEPYPSWGPTYLGLTVSSSETGSANKLVRFRNLKIKRIP